MGRHDRRHANKTHGQNIVHRSTAFGFGHKLGQHVRQQKKIDIEFSLNAHFKTTLIIIFKRINVCLTFSIVYYL